MRRYFSFSNFFFFFLILSSSPIFAFEAVPMLSIVDMQGRFYTLTEGIAKRDAVIYFMDAANPDDRNFLFELEKLRTRFDGELDVIAVAVKMKGGLEGKTGKEFASFIKENRFDFYAGLEEDTRDIKNLSYGGEPGVLYLISRTGRVYDQFRDNEITIKNVKRMWAERNFQIGSYITAGLLFSDLFKEDTEDLNAGMGLGYSLVHQKRMKEAEELFEKITVKNRTSGYTGQAYTTFVSGSLDRCRLLIGKITEGKAPEEVKEPLFHIIMGNLALLDGDYDTMMRAYKTATTYDHKTALWVKAEARNMLAYSYLKEGRPQNAISSLYQALSDDPYNKKAAANKAKIMWEQGLYHLAEKKYADILEMTGDDIPANAFMTEIKELKRLETDEKEQKRINFELVRLTANYNRGEWNRIFKKVDKWTSGPMVIYYAGFEGDSLGRADLADGTGLAVYQKLAETGRIRKIPFARHNLFIKKIGIETKEELKKEEQNIAKIFGAPFIMEGSVNENAKSELTIKLLIKDTETGETTVSLENIVQYEELGDYIEDAVVEIEEQLYDKFPLKGKVAFIEDDYITVNLGNRHGISAGNRFAVMRDVSPVIKNEFVVKYDQEKVGEIIITDVGRDISYAKSLEGGGLKIHDKLLELR